MKLLSLLFLFGVTFLVARPMRDVENMSGVIHCGKEAVESKRDILVTGRTNEAIHYKQETFDERIKPVEPRKRDKFNKKLRQTGKELETQLNKIHGQQEASEAGSQTVNPRKRDQMKAIVDKARTKMHEIVHNKEGQSIKDRARTLTRHLKEKGKDYKEKGKAVLSTTTQNKMSTNSAKSADEGQRSSNPRGPSKWKGVMIIEGIPIQPANLDTTPPYVQGRTTSKIIKINEGSEIHPTGERDPITQSTEILEVPRMIPPKKETSTQELTNSLGSNIPHTNQQPMTLHNVRQRLITRLINFKPQWIPRSSNDAKAWAIIAMNHGNQWAQKALVKATAIGVGVLDKVFTAVENTFKNTFGDRATVPSEKFFHD